MLDQVPTASRTFVIPQPKICFVYNKEKNVFDVFNTGALPFLWRIDGCRSGNDVVDSICEAYTEVRKSVVETDYKSLAFYLEKRGYLQFDGSGGGFYLELADRSAEVKPVHAEIELTRNCNLSCAYCYANAAQARSEDDLPFGMWEKILSELMRDGLRAVKISGGEPFLHKDVGKFLDYCAQHFIVSLNTNGWFIDKGVAQHLSELRLQCVQVSLDSASPAWHDKVRGRGSWRKAMDALESLALHDVPLRISSTISTRNASDIPHIKAIASQLGAETNFEIMKPTGRAAKLGDGWFIEDACEVVAHNSVSPIFSALAALEIKCQAQLGFVGLSSGGNVKPCNLPETFFENLGISVLSPVRPGTFSYAGSDTYVTTEEYCGKVVAAEAREGGRSYDRCIFYHRN